MHLQSVHRMALLLTSTVTLVLATPARAQPDINTAPLFKPFSVNAATQPITTAGDASVPRLRLTRDQSGRELIVETTSGEPVATYDVDTARHTVSLHLNSGLSFTVSATPERGVYESTLAGSTGAVIDRRTVAAHRTHMKRHFDLDIVRGLLGLSDDWMNTLQFQSSRSAVTVRTPAGVPLVSLMHRDGDNLAVDSSGRALFYDIAVDLLQGRHDDPSLLVGVQGIVPDHIVITADGRVGAYVDGPAAASVFGFWSERTASGSLAFAYRSEVRGDVAQSHRKVTSESAGNRHAQTDSCILIDEQVTQVCYSGDYQGCDPPVITDTYACSADGGGGGGDTGGGGGGGGSVSNVQISDPTLYNKVTAAKGNAATKLSLPACQAMIQNNTNAAGISLWDVLLAYAPDAVTYLNGSITFRSGNGVYDLQGNIPCNYGRLAWVYAPGAKEIQVCSAFNTLSSGDAGAVTIHEMLHTLGLPEDDTGQTAMTSQQIQQMVVNACGNN